MGGDERVRINLLLVLVLRVALLERVRLHHALLKAHTEAHLNELHAHTHTRTHTHTNEPKGWLSEALTRHAGLLAHLDAT